jgi:hypothetical protein
LLPEIGLLVSSWASTGQGKGLNSKEFGFICLKDLRS